jgi:hypothetical protein
VKAAWDKARNQLLIDYFPEDSRAFLVDNSRNYSSDYRTTSKELLEDDDKQSSDEYDPPQL